MFVLDLAVALLAGAFFARRAGRAALWVSQAFVAFGMVLPSLPLWAFWPAWHVGFLWDPAPTAGLLWGWLLLPAAWLGHRLALAWPRFVSVALVLTSMSMWFTMSRATSLGDEPTQLLAAAGMLSLVTGLGFAWALRATRPAPVGPREVATFCRLCEAHCGLVATVEDGQVRKLVPDRSHPVTQGYACVKGIGLGAIQSDPDRVDHPLKRVDGAFVRIPWDQALREIGQTVRRIRAEHPPRAIAMYRGNPSFFSYQHVVFASDFLRALGSDNLFTSVSIDSNNKFFVATELYGHPMLQPVPDLARCHFFLCMGSNPMVSQASIVALPHVRRRLQEVVDRGGRVVWVDPRRTESAEAVGEHVPIVPGTDVFLLLAMLHVVRDRVDRPSLAGTCEGVDAFLALADGHAPEDVATRTGVPADTVRDLAEALLAADGAFIYHSTGVNMGPFGSLCAWLVQGLQIVAGTLDRPGGGLVADGAFDLVGATGGQAWDPDRRRSTVGSWPSVAGAFPTASLASQITTDHPERVRALFVTGGNPVHSVPGRQLQEALDALELLVCVELYRSETAAHADYILPAADLLEHSDFPIGWMLLQETPYAQFTEALVPPAHERRPEWQIFSDLALACGIGPRGPTVVHALPWANRMLGALGAPPLTPDHLLALLLRQGGEVTLGQLRDEPSGVLLPAHRPGSFLGQRVRTPSGKVRLAPEALLADVARLHATEAPDDDRLHLIGLRERKTHNSWFHNHPSVKQPATNRARMHPDDAAARGIRDGDTIRITSDEGQIELPVSLTDEVSRQVVAVPHGWDHRGAGTSRAPLLGGANINRVIPGAVMEPVSGQARMVAVRVQVDRVCRLPGCDPRRRSPPGPVTP